MKAHYKGQIVAITLTTLLVVMVLGITLSRASRTMVNVGTTSSFAVLAGSTITNIGMTTISGDVGLYPGVFFPGEASILLNGTLYLTDAIAITAQEDLVIAYNDANRETSNITRIPSELGGTTLTPGTYNSSDGTFRINGTLTLDAQGKSDGVFVFKTTSTLITTSDSKVNLVKGARSFRTFWKVGSSVILGTGSHFVGHILAMESITVTTGATVQGQLLARNGAVTLDNNIIINELGVSNSKSNTNIIGSATKQ